MRRLRKMKMLIITMLSVIVFGALFVMWANKPENVEALKKQREADAAQKKMQEKAKVKAEKEEALTKQQIESKRAGLRLVIDEHFTNGKLEKLDFSYPHIDYFKFEKNEFHFSGMLTRGQNAQDYFMGSKENFGDFIAEMQTGIWGGDTYAGIFWEASENGKIHPGDYRAAYASPGTLYVEVGKDKESVSLGGLISSENNQLLRVERMGDYVKVSVNGRVLFDRKMQSGAGGRLGMLIGHRGGIRGNTQSISIAVKSFKVWQ